jgi:NAD-dependent SIR2 family protein deacetylase
MLDAIKSFPKRTLKPATTIEKDVMSMITPPVEREKPETQWVRTDGGWREVPVGLQQGSGVAKEVPMEAAPHEMHGQCYGFADERNKWAAPATTFSSVHDARPGYSTMSASEYQDDSVVLVEKVKHLARLVRASQCCVIFAGAGLSTAAGIDDYATHNRRDAGGGEVLGHLRSPMCAQPTAAHRVLVGMHRGSMFHRLIQQNHDGLPQKAGLPQHAVNEIHGALHAPDNPVIPMSGCLREDLLADVLECERRCDLVLAVGTSIAGMNVDRIVHSANERASSPASHVSASLCHGSVIIGLQRTTADAQCTLRIFATCDEVFCRLAEELKLGDLVPSPPAPGRFFCQPVLRDDDASANAVDGVTRAEEDGAALDRYLLHGLEYDAMGRQAEGLSSQLDVRDGAVLAIPTGIYAGATGIVDGWDREGNPRCRFNLRLKPTPGSMKAPTMRVLGTWWLQAAHDGTAHQLPVVNMPRDEDDSPAATELRGLCQEYAK